MNYSGIGGQAVMEGVMMRNGDKYAVAIRKPDHEIVVEKKDCKDFSKTVWSKIPLVRGVVSFVDSLVMGLSTLMFSASFFEEEEETKPVKNKEAKEKLAKTSLSFKNCALLLFEFFIIKNAIFMKSVKLFKFCSCFIFLFFNK